MTPEQRELFIKHLVSLGEAEVRLQMANRLTGIGASMDQKPLAEVWLAGLDADRAAASSAKRDAREEETLSIARKALESSTRAERHAERANKIAISAIVFATITATIAIIW